MKRLFLLLTSFLLLLSSCASGSGKKANNVIYSVRENAELFTRCAEEMRDFHLERFYVAMEDDKETEENDPRLVAYEKESGARTAIENENLQKALVDFDLKIIFFQTAADSRQCVIFSFAKEKDEGIVNGFYYSFDALPCAWWGRQADLNRKGNQYLQIDEHGSAWYQTVQIQDSLYYFEKHGSLNA